MRFQAQLALIQNGRVYLPEQAFWLAEYLDEVKTFPNSAHKDQVDSTTQALEWFRQLPKGWGGMEYWRNLAANLAKELSEDVVLLAPKGVTHVYTIRGEMKLVGNDRRVSVPKEGITGLLHRGFRRL